MKTSLINWILILMAFNIASCGAAPLDGQVLALQPGYTIQGVNALLGGTARIGQIWMNTTSVVFVWPVDNAWAFVGVDSTRVLTPATFYRLTGGKANLVNWVTMGDVAGCLRANGWKLVTAAEVPEGVKLLVNGAGSAARGLISILVFPYLPSMVPEEFVQPKT